MMVFLFWGHFFGETCHDFPLINRIFLYFRNENLGTEDAQYTDRSLEKSYDVSWRTDRKTKVKK